MLNGSDYTKEQRRKRMARKKRKKRTLVQKDSKSNKNLSRRIVFEKYEAAE
jgi:hypothetical protein